MSSQIRFFATEHDLIPVLDAFEEIKYVRYGSYDTPAPEWYPSAMAIPDLGVASNESAVNCTTFLVCREIDSLRPRQVGSLDSKKRYVFDQLINPDTITFSPGGLWREEILLYGTFASASNSLFSSQLLKVAGSALKKRCKKIKAFYVGPEAEGMLRTGKRLTIAEQASRSTDLAV
jgi:hypothetical protein